jgi:hypothetical protein
MFPIQKDSPANSILVSTVLSQRRYISLDGPRPPRAIYSVSLADPPLAVVSMQKLMGLIATWLL